jgi:hypothetical protein
MDDMEKMSQQILPQMNANADAIRKEIKAAAEADKEESRKANQELMAKMD